MTDKLEGLLDSIFLDRVP